MSLTFVGWLLIVSSIAISTLLVLPLRSRGSRRQELDLESCKARLEEIGTRLKLGKLNEAEADAARLALLYRPRPSSPIFTSPRFASPGFSRHLRGISGTSIVAAAVFLLVAGIGAITWYVEGSPEVTGSEGTSADLLSPSASDGEMLASLTDYTRSIGGQKPAAGFAPAAPSAEGKMLPDVNTMIERLAARLETAPNDIEGWRTLGWSYFHTARYEEAASAFAKAVELDPTSAELKRSYEEAKAKASDGDASGATSSLQTEAVNKGHDGLSIETTAEPEVAPPPQRDAQIRSMVDGLAARLESSPRDVEGWTRLMRSRVVLGEKEVAATALRKALEVFKDDSEASSMITAAAAELGLKAE